jgi:acetyltransferase-like isoleucine patch superfamily enzyme
MNLMIKITRKVFRVPMRIFEFLEDKRKREGCIAGVGVLLAPRSGIGNFQSDPSSIRIGANTQVYGELLVFAHGGKIEIGEACFIGANSRIWSVDEITIGNRVQIAHDVNIHDNNSHSLSAHSRYLHFAQLFSNDSPELIEDVSMSKVVIEDDVWVGYGASILKGVRVGNGAVVGAASMVTKDVPAYAIVVGNPARIVGQSKP